MTVLSGHLELTEHPNDSSNHQITWKDLTVLKGLYGHRRPHKEPTYRKWPRGGRRGCFWTGFLLTSRRNTVPGGCVAERLAPHWVGSGAFLWTLETHGKRRFHKRVFLSEHTESRGSEALLQWGCSLSWMSTWQLVWHWNWGHAEIGPIQNGNNVNTRSQPCPLIAPFLFKQDSFFYIKFWTILFPNFS